MLIKRYDLPWALRAAETETGAGGGEPPAETTSGTGEATEAQDGGAEATAEDEGGAAAAAGQAEEIPPILPKKDWRDREIARKHAKLQASEQARLTAEAENQRLKELIEANQRRGGAAVETTDDTTQQRQQQAATVPASEVERRAEALAVQRQAAAELEAQCNAVLDKGKQDYGEKEWTGAIEQLQTLGGYDPDTLAGILATDDPARVIFEMASNPDTYHELMELTPAKRLAKMATMAAAPKPKKKVSQAPEAITDETVSGRANAGGGLSDDLSDDEWYKRRQAQKRKRWAERNQGGRAA